jgi:hypothetical protein
MNQHVTPLPVVEKHRTITLTNQPPVQIKESEWPVIAQGKANWDHPGLDIGWVIDIRVRQKPYTSEAIVHASYNYMNAEDEEGQQVRVGRTLTAAAATWDLPNQMIEVAAELRARILDTRHKEHVVYALDACFAQLPVRVL